MGKRLGLKVSGRYSEVAAIRRWPLFGGGRYSEVAAIRRWPLFGGGRYSEVAALRGSTVYIYTCAVHGILHQICPLVLHSSRAHQFQCFPLFSSIHKFRASLLYNSCISMDRNVFTFEIPIAHTCSSCW